MIKRICTDTLKMARQIIQVTAVAERTSVEN